MSLNEKNRGKKKAGGLLSAAATATNECMYVTLRKTAGTWCAV